MTIARDSQTDSRGKDMHPRIRQILDVIDCGLESEQEPFDEAPGMPEEAGEASETDDGPNPMMAGYVDA